MIPSNIKVTETRVVECRFDAGSDEYADWLNDLHSEAWILSAIHPGGAGFHIFVRLRLERLLHP